MSHRILPGVATLLYALLGCGGQEVERPSSEAIPLPDTRPAPGPLQILYSWPARVLRCEFDHGDYKELTIEDAFDNGVSWSAHRSYHSTAYRILRVANSSKDTLYVLGLADSGDHVIEQWKERPFVDGGPTVGSGPLYERTEVYRSSVLGAIAEIGVDPEGRFLLVLHGTPRRLSTLSLDAGHAVSTVFTSSQIPFLAQADALSPLQHITEGRLWVAEGPLDPGFLVLKDANNDAAFEDHVLLTFDQWDSEYVHVPWADALRQRVISTLSDLADLATGAPE